MVLIGRRWGKSFLLVVMALEDCLRKPETTVRIIGPEIDQTIGIILPLIMKICVDAPYGLIRPTKSYRHWHVGKSILILGGFDKKNIEKHRGTESDAIYIEETGSSDSLEYDYAMREVLMPHLLLSRGPLTHFTTPPKEIDHPFILTTIPTSKVNGAFFEYTIYDNPMLSSAQIQEAIDDCGGVTSVAFRREHLVQIFRDETRMIVPEFDVAKHVPKVDIERPQYANYWIAGDYGGQEDGTSFGLIYYHFDLAKIVIDSELFYEPQIPNSVIAPEVLELEATTGKDLERWVDMPGQTRVDLDNDYGFWTQAPLKDDADAALQFLRKLFIEGKILVNPSCKQTILTLATGQWNDRRTDYKRTPILFHCDPIDMLKYGMRHINYANPYPETILTEDQMPSRAERDKVTTEQAIARTLQPRVFGRNRRA